jgi:hypothetical protein
MSTLVGENNFVGDGLAIRSGDMEEKKDGASFSCVETGHPQRPDGASSGAQGFVIHGKEPFASVDSIDDLGDLHFESLDELYDKLVELGLSDSKYKLDINGFAVMPGKRHNRGTRHLGKQLEIWNRGWFGSWGQVSNDNLMQVPGLTPTGRQKQREPDVAFWGYPRCDKIAGNLVAKDRPDDVDFDVDPDVVFQFSDGNTSAKEEEAINLIMVGGIGGNDGPRVGYLFKLQRDAGKPVGIDIYKVPRGRTLGDAINQANGATHVVYMHNQPHDECIAISPEEMGIDGMWAKVCPSFKLSMKEFWRVGRY